MGICGKLERELELKASAEKFFKLFEQELHILPDISSHNVHGAELHEGHHWHTPSAVKQWDLTLADGTKITCKESIEDVDEANKAIRFKLFGEDVEKSYKDMKATFHAVDKEGGGGCLVKWVYEYEKVSEDVPEPEAYIDFAVNVSQAVGDHLISK